MKIFLEVNNNNLKASETAIVNLLVLNDSYEPIAIDRRLLVGPNPVPERLAGIPFPVSVEPALPQEDENLITLNPWCFYGRQRTFNDFPPGQVKFYGYLMRHTSDILLAEKPGEPDALFLSAEALVVTIH